MIEKHFSNTYQKYCITPYLQSIFLRTLNPISLTYLACFFGIAIYPLLLFGCPYLAVLFLAFSGFLDTLDGSLARYYQKTSLKGAALDIISDRIVEFAIILGLYSIDPLTRALPSLWMLGSCFICVTSFLIVGMFTQNTSTKSFHYSTGLIERAEAFIFFAIMILFPSTFVIASYLFSALVLLTATVRIVQFQNNINKESS